MNSRILSWLSATTTIPLMDCEGIKSYSLRRLNIFIKSWKKYRKITFTAIFLSQIVKKFHCAAKIGWYLKFAYEKKTFSTHVNLVMALRSRTKLVFLKCKYFFSWGHLASNCPGHSESCGALYINYLYLLKDNDQSHFFLLLLLLFIIQLSYFDFWLLIGQWDSDKFSIFKIIGILQL